ncbi:MAG: DUF4153 domain-containing protein [Vicingaceae bacterium]
MKAPSLSYLSQKAKKSFIRFPMTIISASIAVVIGIYLTEYESDNNNFLPYFNLLLTAALGIPIYFCISILLGKKRTTNSLQLLAYSIGTLILVGIYDSLPSSEITNNTSVPYIRYVIFNIIAHLLVSFVPYLKKGNLNGFWNYNKALFIRILTSILYSGFLYVGLILALAALDLLFDIEIHKELYLEIFIIIIGLFNTWFFVSGVPQDLDALEDISTYPKGLKIFTQFVLLPLLTLYLTILYFYGGKIIIEWNWPRGIVSYMISMVAVLGILTMLLVYPFGKLKENAWIKKFTHAYYILLIPLIVILFFAIHIRINDYGVTINRYIIVLLGIWLSIVAVFFSLRRTNIKFIPISLVIILIPMSFGPWSMFSVSELSQSNRLKNILKEYSIIEHGKVQNEVIWVTDSLPKFYAKEEFTNENILPDSIHNEVKSIIHYLDGHHGFKKLDPIFSQNLDSLLKVAHDSSRYIYDAEIYIRSLGLKNVHFYIDGDSEHFNYSIRRENAIKVKDYDYLYDFDHYQFKGRHMVKIGNFLADSIDFQLHLENNSLDLQSSLDSINFNINSLFEDLKSKYDNQNNSDIAGSEMTILKSTKTINVKLQILSLEVNESKDSTFFRNIKGKLFLKIKPND